ncbi:hypothetical protein A2U01_0044068, partial [Trifolium medium]|nr:hypothetical protein [Trifolium medium]
MLNAFQEFQHDMKESFLDIKKSLQAVSDSFKLKSWEKKLPEKIVKEEPKKQRAEEEEPEKQRAEEVETLTQPQQLSRPPVSTPLPEFANGKNGYDYFSPPSPLVLPPSQAGRSRKSPDTILAKPLASKPPPKPPDEGTPPLLLPSSHFNNPPSRPPRKPPPYSLLSSENSFDVSTSEISSPP